MMSTLFPVIVYAPGQCCDFATGVGSFDGQPDAAPGTTGTAWVPTSSYGRTWWTADIVLRRRQMPNHAASADMHSSAVMSCLADNTSHAAMRSAVRSCGSLQRATCVLEQAWASSGPAKRIRRC